MTGKEIGLEFAFPKEGQIVRDVVIDGKAFGTFQSLPHVGLTKREAFAMAALQGICADRREKRNLPRVGAIAIATNAIEIADALLEELAKEAP